MGELQQIVELEPKKINVGWRARKDLDSIDLQESITESGQLQPIVVRKQGAKFDLIAGHRRLLACKALNRKVLAVVVDAEDDEQSLKLQLIENMKRRDFTALELGEGLSKYQALYQAKFPQTKKGKGSTKNKASDEAKVDAFAKVAATQLGMGETKVRDAIQLATELETVKKEEILAITNPSQRRKAERQALSTLRKERRAKKLEAVAASSESSQDEASNVKVSVLHIDAKSGLENVDGSFDLVLTDPPYNLKWGSLIAHEERAQIGSEDEDWDILDLEWVEWVAPHLAENATVVAFCPAEAIGLYQGVFSDCGLDYRGAMVWYKTNPGTKYRGGWFLQATEYLVMATKGKPYFKPFANAGSEEAHNVFRAPICGGNERLDHAAQKPEKLIDQLLERFGHEKSAILDPFAGVGTTLVCAKRRGISALGFEKDEKYAHLADIRIKSV